MGSPDDKKKKKKKKDESSDKKGKGNNEKKPKAKKTGKKKNPNREGNAGGEDYSSDSSSSSSSDKEKHRKNEQKGDSNFEEPPPPPIPETRHTEEIAAAMVSAIIALMYHLVPVRQPLRFKVTVGCSIDMEYSKRPPYPKLYAKVFFKDTDDNPRRTRVTQWEPDQRIDWDQDEFESVVEPGEPCEVSIQIIQDNPEEIIMNKMYPIEWLKIHSAINHDKTWGFPLPTNSHGTGRIYVCCRCTGGRPHEVTDFSMSPLPELHAFLPNSPPAAAFRGGGLILNNGDGAAGRKLFNFFNNNCPEKLHQVPQLLNDYLGREDHLIDMHATVYRWWDWGTDPTEVGKWIDKIPHKDTNKRTKRTTVRE